MVPSRFVRWGGLFTLAMSGLTLAGCTGGGMLADPTGYPGTQQRIMSYYDRNATEEHMVCTNPRMTAITRSQTLQDTSTTVVLKVRYRYELPNRSRPSNDQQGQNTGYGPGCNGFETRQFTLAKTPQGLVVRSMTGEQRR